VSASWCDDDWASFGSSHGSDTFEHIFQLVIVIAILSTNRCRLLRALQYSLKETLLGATVRFNAEPALRPQLSLGATRVGGWIRAISRAA
jgi:hypothetical protein